MGAGVWGRPREGSPEGEGGSVREGWAGPGRGVRVGLGIWCLERGPGFQYEEPLPQNRSKTPVFSSFFEFFLSFFEFFLSFFEFF